MQRHSRFDGHSAGVVVKLAERPDARQVRQDYADRAIALHALPCILPTLCRHAGARFGRSFVSFCDRPVVQPSSLADHAAVPCAGRAQVIAEAVTPAYSDRRVAAPRSVSVSNSSVQLVTPRKPRGLPGPSRDTAVPALRAYGARARSRGRSAHGDEECLAASGGGVGCPHGLPHARGGGPALRNQLLLLLLACVQPPARRS